MPKPERVFKVECTLLGHTDKAVRAHLTALDEETWLPLSVILNVEDLFNSDSSLRSGSAQVELPEWLAKRKGLV